MNMHTSPIKPIFEVRKRYHTREGWILTIHAFAAGSIYPIGGGMFDRITGRHWWTIDRRWLHYSESVGERDLIPAPLRT